MSSLTTSTHNDLLDSIFGSGTPATYYFGLYTVAPTVSGGGTEVTGGSYARVAFTNNSSNFPAASGGVKTTGNAAVFPTPTADWGSVVACGIFDASTAGTLVGFADVTTQSVPTGVVVTVTSGATITLAAA